MTSVTTEPPTLRSFPPIATTSPQRRSYSCYNCNYSFHITPTAATSPSSPSSFRCPRCHHRHLIPHHTIISPPPTPPRSPPILPTQRSDYAVVSSSFVHHTSDDSSSDDDDYDSDNSLSFTIPNSHPSTPASKSFIASLPIKIFSPNSTSSLQSCSICMDDFEVNYSEESVIINELPCQHYFHKDCIAEWLQRSNTCPLCRHELPVDSSPKKGIDDQWEEEYDAVLVVDLASTREPLGGRVDREESVSSIAVAPGSDRDGLSVNDGDISSWDFEPMRDEDGDTLMIDAVTM